MLGQSVEPVWPIDARKGVPVDRRLPVDLKQECAVKFSYTHHMPYTHVDEAGQDWPIPNKQFDPEKGVALYREYIDNKVFAEEVGFDWIGCNEHHMSPYGLMPNPNLTAAAIIERTGKAGILQSGNIVPLTNPIRIAEEYAMLDVQSGGRLITGLMRGIPHEYVAYNVAPDDSYPRMREACELILKCGRPPPRRRRNRNISHRRRARRRPSFPGLHRGSSGRFPSRPRRTCRGW